MGLSNHDTTIKRSRFYENEKKKPIFQFFKIIIIIIIWLQLIFVL